MMDGAAVSLVVVCKDEATLERTLDATDGLADVDETIVVDASSGRLDWIRRRFPSVRWIDYVQPDGVSISIAAQRNVGVGAAKGDVVVFLDAGCEVCEGWLGCLLAPMRDQDEQLVVGPVQSRASTIYDHSAAKDGRVYPSGDKLYVREYATLNMAVRSSVLEAIGPFDEAFDYGSDVDFTWRARDRGINLRYAPDAVVFHEWGNGARQMKRAFHYGVGRARLYLKHPDHVSRILRDDPITVIYPVFLLGLPLTLRWRSYVFLVLIPIWRNRRTHPLLTLADHLAYGAGVLRELSRATHRRRRDHPLLNARSAGVATPVASNRLYP